MLLFPLLWVVECGAAVHLYPFSTQSGFSTTSSSFDSTYIGGNGTDHIYATAISSNGEHFLAGSTSSTTFYPVVDDIQIQKQDMFILKLPQVAGGNGFLLVIQGSEFETIRDLSMGAEGELWFIGESNSPDLPVSDQRYAWRGKWDAYFGKIDIATGEVIFSGYFGGNDIDYGHTIDVSESLQIAIGGETWSRDFPVTDNAFMRQCGALPCDSSSRQQDGFVSVINGLLPFSDPQYSTYFGGNDSDGVHSIEFDQYGHLHVAGNTFSSDLPLKLPLQRTYRGNNDGFYLRLATNQYRSNSLLVSTYLGGGNEDRLNTLHIDIDQNVWLGGYSHSTDWMMSADALDASCGDAQSRCDQQGQADMVILKIGHEDPDRVLFSSFWGGSGSEAVTGIDSNADFVFISASSDSFNFPLTNRRFDLCEQEDCMKMSHGALLQFGRNDLKLYASERISGNGEDYLNGVQVSGNRILLEGSSKSNNLLLQADPRYVFDDSCGSDGFCDAGSSGRLFDGFLSLMPISNTPMPILSGGDRIYSKITNNQQVKRNRGHGLYLFPGIIILLLLRIHSFLLRTR